MLFCGEHIFCVMMDVCIDLAILEYTWYYFMVYILQFYSIHDSL